MALYRYEALDGDGRTIRGTAEADTPADARATLRSGGLYAKTLEPALANRPAGAEGTALRDGWRALSGKRLELLSTFCRHFAMLLRSGLPLAQALQVLTEQFEDRRFREVVRDLGVRVREGAALDHALAVHPGYFPELFVCVTRAGATAGNLPQVLGDLAQYYTRQKRLRDRVVSALTYPLLMAGIGLVVLFFLLAYVVPKVTAVLIEQKKALPWPTEVLLFASHFVQDWWWALLAGIALTVWAWRAALRTTQGRLLADGLTLRLPVIGELVRKQAVARWADTMSNLLSSGIPVAHALAVVREALGNAVLAAEVRKLEKGVLDGADMSDVIKESRELPKAIGYVVGVGEESGELARVLKEVAEGYNEEVDVVAERLAEVVNPVLIVFLGVVVGFIVAAILLPITDFSNVQ